MSSLPPAPAPESAPDVSALQAECRALSMCLARRVATLPEAAMRTAAIVEQLQRHGSHRAVWVLEELIRGALRKEADSLSAYDSLLDPEPVAERLEEPFLRGMLESGLEDGCVAAVQWLRGHLFVEEAKEAIDPNRMIAWGLREMTLGDRRALARRASGDTIIQLQSDPDAGVIVNLLNNPRTTSRIVLAICSRRPTVPPPLLAVLRSRWIRRYPVKLSLVRNPYLELRFGLNLLVYLTSRDLRDVRDDQALSPILYLGAQRLGDLRLAPVS